MTEKHPSRPTPDYFTGCLLAGAVGDALGAGWIAEEALDIGLYCALAHENNMTIKFKKVNTICFPGSPRT
jgi:hypothetical protein